MKKLYSFVALGAFAALPAFAQEEDVTNLIKNPGFDLDLTFQADGSIKELIDESSNLSNRSHKWIAADGTIYAGTIQGSSNPNWKRTDDPHMCVNGFLGQIAGWELSTGSNGEWTYFGAIPYGVGETAIGIADDNTGSWLTMAEKPEADSGEDNVASMYLRAGWTNYAAYTQTVSLPCAQYRLEYWINNLNYAATDASGLENLCKITCRKDVFPDSTGVNADGWELHTIEFTPTAEFTIQMGFKAGNYGSGKNPILLIDGMKLYKIGEADKEELLKADLNQYCEELLSIAYDDLADYSGLGDFIQKKVDEFLESEGDIEAMEQASKEALAYIEVAKGFLAKAEKFVEDVDKAYAIMEEEVYPGIEDFQAALEAFSEYISNGLEPDGDVDAIEYLEAQSVALQKAIADYYASQGASEDEPANYTFYVNNPTFEEKGNWYTTYEGGDQSIKTDKTDNDGNPINCWNAWSNNLSAGAIMTINQDIVGIPNGKYSVTADLNTQDGCITNQHVYAKSTLGTAESEVLSVTGWDPCVWETLTTSMVIVTDGKLTIGAIGVSDGLTPAEFGGTDTDKRRGWFNMANVKLNYHGTATDEEIAAAVAQKYVDAKAYAEQMHLAADKAAYQAAIAAAEAAGDLEALDVATAEAEASETDYIGAVNNSYKTLSDSIANGASDNYVALAKVPVQKMTDYLNSAAATHTELATYYNVTIYYRDNLLPALGKAEAALETAGEKGKALISANIESVKTALAKWTNDTEVLDEQVGALNKAVKLAELADIAIADGADMTKFIENANVDAETGWTFDRPKGDKNSTTSQGVDGDGNNRYLDCWQSAAGTTRFTAYQVLDVPNGKYTVANIMRTSGVGAYLFASDKAPVTNEEGALTLDPAASNVLSLAVATATPNAKYGIETEDGAEETVYTDSYGAIWMGAADRVMAAMGITPVAGNTIYDLAVDANSGSDECPANVDPADWAIIAANTGKGRGWFNNSLEIEVTNHTLVLGISCDSVFTAPAQGVPFEGTWFSADNFKLTLVKAGDNAGWDPTTAISEVADAAATKVEAIYTISGARVAGLQKGINIVRKSNGTVQKVLVK